MQVEFRLPSALPYAYVNVTGTPEELGQINYEMLASLYANSLTAFKRAEANAVDLIAQGVQPPALEPLPKASEPLPPAPRPYDDSDAVAGTIKDQLGATEIDNVNEAPYKAPAPAAKAKPWEKEKPAPTVAVDIDGW